MIDFLYIQKVKLKSCKRFWDRAFKYFWGRTIVYIHNPSHGPGLTTDFTEVDQLIVWISERNDDMWEISSWGQNERSLYILRFRPKD